MGWPSGERGLQKRDERVPPFLTLVLALAQGDLLRQGRDSLVNRTEDKDVANLTRLEPPKSDVG